MVFGETWVHPPIHPDRLAVDCDFSAQEMELLQMPRLLLADDHDLVRETIADYLQRKAGVEIVQAADFDAAWQHVSGGERFDLILLDYAMPGMNGLFGLEKMLAITQSPVAILSGTAPPDIARRATRAGAAGFLPKTLAPEDMVGAVGELLEGRSYMPVDLTVTGPGEGSDIQLTPRERDVLRGVAEGKSNKEIARDLNIQEVTVKLHVKTLSRKLGARNRTHAAMLGRDLGLT